MESCSSGAGLITVTKQLHGDKETDETIPDEHEQFH